MNFTELDAKLRAVGVIVPDGTIRRWAFQDKLVARPKRYWVKGGGKGRRTDWPEEAFEDVAVVFVLRNSYTYWAKPRTEALREAKEFVSKFYEIIDKSRRTSDTSVVNELDQQLVWVEITPNKYFAEGGRGMMHGDYQLHPLIVQWIITLEKLRNGKPLFEPGEVTLTWHRAATSDGARQLIYDGVSIEASKADQLSRHFE